MRRNRIFISTTTFGGYSKEPLQLLNKNRISYTLNLYKRRLSEDEIGSILKKDSYIGLIAGTEPLTKEVLEAATRSLRVISRLGVGLDNIDLDAARRFNIKIYNTPDVLTDSVAELTIGLILCSLRRINSMDRNVRRKLWKKDMGLLFKRKNLGIIGLGKIGEKVARLAQAFGADIIFYDIRPIRHNRFKQVSLNRLLKDSDIISIHSSSNKQLIAKKEIARMKKGSILINTSRGAVINEEDLYGALRKKTIAFAALDVFNKEPYYGKLNRLENVILTPHIGSYAKESRIEMEKEAVQNLIKGLSEVRLL